MLFAHLFNCSESNVKSRYTPTHDSIQKLVSFFHFYLLGGPIYIYSNAKQEKSNLDLNTSKKEGHDDKIQVYSLLRTSHGFVLKNTSVRASYINFFFGLLIKDLSDGHLPWLCTPCFTNCSSIIS